MTVKFWSEGQPGEGAEGVVVRGSAPGPVEVEAGPIELGVDRVLEAKAHVDPPGRLRTITERCVVELHGGPGAVGLKCPVTGVDGRIGRAEGVERSEGRADLVAP